MKEYNEVKREYIKDHLKQTLKEPERRLNALAAIEKIIRSNSPELLQSDNLFRTFSKNQFFTQYLDWKGKPLSGAEKSVIVGLFKFSK